MTDNVNTKPEAQVFAAVIQDLDAGTPLRNEMYKLFCREMKKAVNNGCICTPERMALLYPIFREINIEMDAIEAELAKFNNRGRRRP